MASNRGLFVTAAIVLATLAGTARADSLNEALAAAYANNPTLNAERAATRVTDENVPQALSGYRPRVSGFGTVGSQRSDTTQATGSQNFATAGITITQPIFNGFQTVNNTKAAEAQVRAQREALRNTEQNVLLDAATAYMDVVRDQQILKLRRSDVRFLQEQVRAANDRLSVGEGTRTDVAQSEARLASAQSQVSLARANLEASIGTYRQVIGRDPKGVRGRKPSTAFCRGRWSRRSAPPGASIRRSSPPSSARTRNPSWCRRRRASCCPRSSSKEPCSARGKTGSARPPAIPLRSSVG